MKPYFRHSIAVTGGFASGKSSVAKSLAEILGYCLFDADEEVASLLKTNADGWLALRTVVDPVFFSENGDIDKPKLRQSIFTDDILRKRIEGLLHPLVRENLKSKIDVAYARDGKKSLVEVPLLYEAKWQDDFPLVIVVSVSEQKSIERATKRDGVTVEQVQDIIYAQVPLMEKALLADYVIDNEKDWSDTMKQLIELKKNLDTRILTA